MWFHIARYPQEYVAFNEVAFTVTHTPPILTGDVKVVYESFLDTWASLFGFYHVLAPIIVWAVVALARRRSEGDRVLLVLAGALVAGFVLLIRNRWISYFILLTPVIDLMIAAFLVQQAQRPWRGRLSDYARWTAIGGAILRTVALNVYALVPGRYEEFQQAQAFVEQVVEPGDRIMAEQVYWFGLREHDYYSWEALIFYQRYFDGSNLEGAFYAFRPDIFIVDGAVAAFTSDEPGESLYEQQLWLSQRELYAFLNRRATLVGVTHTEYFGSIKVYRIQWERADGDR